MSSSEHTETIVSWFLFLTLATFLLVVGPVLAGLSAHWSNQNPFEAVLMWYVGWGMLGLFILPHIHE
jgi:hypothetical protein